jgi:hypothetical protein
VTLAGKVAELNLGQYSAELLKLAVRQAVNPSEAASHLREIQVLYFGQVLVPEVVSEEDIELQFSLVSYLGEIRGILCSVPVATGVAKLSEWLVIFFGIF